MRTVDPIVVTIPPSFSSYLTFDKTTNKFEWKDVREAKAVRE